jgi:hypothetical protein
VLSKARRGELITPLPVGLVYDGAGHVVLDPDTGVQQALAHLFATFAATGSATACVKTFNDAHLSFPWRHLRGPRKGELDWKPLQHHTVLRVLHNPRYAGAFSYGRHRQQKLPSGKQSTTLLPREDWISFIPGAHPGYITLEQFETNRARPAAAPHPPGARPRVHADRPSTRPGRQQTVPVTSSGAGSTLFRLPRPAPGRSAPVTSSPSTATATVITAVKTTTATPVPTPAPVTPYGMTTGTVPRPDGTI